MADQYTELDTRYLIVKLTLDDTVYPNTGGANVKIIKDLTMDINITKASGYMAGSATAIIYGMLDDDIRVLSRLRLDPAYPTPKNRIDIYAGYNLGSDGLPPLAYTGQIYTAGVDKNDPSRPFIVYSMEYAALGSANLSNTAVKGTISLDDLLSAMVTRYNEEQRDSWVYSSNGVSAIVSNQTYTGSLKNQMTKAANSYGYSISFDPPYIYAYPQNGAPTKQIITINANNGMLGYPTTEQLGISCRIRYNPAIRWGYQVKLETSVYFAEEIINSQGKALTQQIGSWYINAMSTTLQNRDRKWESVLKLNTYQFNIGIEGINDS